MASKRFLLISHNGSNLGDAAIAASTIQHIRSRYPDAYIVLESSFPEISRNYFPDIKVIPRFFAVSGVVGSPSENIFKFLINNIRFVALTGAKVIWLATTSLLRIPHIMPPLLREAMKADKTLSIAGDSISERYAYYLRFWEINAISHLGREIIIYSQSIGPFRSRRVAKWAGRALSRTSLVLARDTQTMKLLKEYGVTTRVVQTADTAISLLPWLSERVKDRLISAGVNSQTVAIVIRTDQYSNIDPGTYTQYLRHMKDLIEHLQKQKTKVVLTGTINEDYAAAKSLIATHHIADCDILNVQDLHPTEAKAVFGSLGLVISPRMHPVILASSMGVPVYGLIQEFKLSSYLRELGLDNCRMPIDKIDPSALKVTAGAIISDRQKYIATITEALKPLKALSLSNAKYL